jgi:hypothetical protein
MTLGWAIFALLIVIYVALRAEVKHLKTRWLILPWPMPIRTNATIADLVAAVRAGRIEAQIEEGHKTYGGHQHEREKAE